MSPHEFARKIVHDYGTALDLASDGLVEELQANMMVLAGMVLALTVPDEVRPALAIEAQSN